MKIYIKIVYLFISISLGILLPLQAKDTISIDTSYFIDENNMELEQIFHTKFIPMGLSGFSLGFHKQNVWFRIDIQNNSPLSDFILDMNEGFYEEAILFYKQDERWKSKTNSMFLNLDQRDVKSRTLAFKIELQPNQKTTLYLKLRAKYGMFGKIEVIPADTYYFKNKINIESFYFAIFGMIFVIGLYHLFIYLNVKQKIYQYYLGYSFFYFIYLINISGMLVYVNLQHYVYKIHLSSTFVVIFLVLFTRELFDIQKNSHFINRTFNFLIIVSLFLAVMFLFSYTPWNKLLNFLALFTNIYLLLIGIYFIYLGSNRAKLYLVAYSIFLGSLLFFILLASGSVPYNTFTRYGFIVGGAIEMIFFSLILASRYTQLQSEQIAVKEKLLELTEQKEKDLNLLVRQRTQELVTQGIKLKEAAVEKEQLLKELRHRVKNNFHSLIGMLWLESKADKTSKNVYIFLLNRVKSMSLIYEYMYDPQKSQSINVNNYINNIVDNFEFYNQGILITKDIDVKIFLDKENLISLGMIVNEVITNICRNSNEISIEILLVNIEKKIYLEIKTDKFIEYSQESLSYKMVKEYSAKLPNVTCDFQYNTNSITFELEFISYNL